MTNRLLSYIVKDQRPLVLRDDETVGQACRSMWERRAGSALVIDGKQRLTGIFTGRDAVRVLAKAKDAAATPLAKAMTREPVTITPDSRAVDALRAMSDGGFRHVPVIEGGRIWGVVSRGDLKGMEFEEFRWRTIKSGADAVTNRELADIVANQKPLALAGTETVRHACRSMAKRNSGSALVVDGRQRLTGIFTGRDAVRVLAKARDAAATRLARAMTRDPMTITPDCRAVDALRAMNDGGFRHLPVVGNGKIIGVVSRNDFSGTEIDRLDEEEHLRECIR